MLSAKKAKFLNPGKNLLLQLYKTYTSCIIFLQIDSTCVEILQSAKIFFFSKIFFILLCLRFISCWASLHFHDLFWCYFLLLRWFHTCQRGEDCWCRLSWCTLDSFENITMIFMTCQQVIIFINKWTLKFLKQVYNRGMNDFIFSKEDTKRTW